MKKLLLLFSLVCFAFISNVNAQIEITLGNVSGNPGDIVSIPVTASLPTQGLLQAFQGTIEFQDDTVMDIIDITDFPTQGGMFNVVNSTQINFLWFDNSTIGVPVNNNTLIFNVNVMLTGVGCSGVDLNDSGIAVEFVVNDVESLASVTPGQVCTNGQNNGSIAISFGCVDGNVGDVVSVPVMATAVGNVNPLAGFQGTIEFDNPNVIDIQGISNFPSAGSGFNVISQSQVVYSWNDAGNPLPIGVNTVLFNVDVLITDLGCTSIDLNGSGIAVEFIDSNANLVNATVTNCDICGVGAGGSLDITFGCTDGAVGETILIPVFATANGNVNPLVGFQGTIEFDNPGVLNILGITDFPNANGGFNVISASQVVYSWSDVQMEIPVGVETFLFNVEIEITAEGCSQIDLNGSGISVEFIDNQTELVDFNVTTCEICGTNPNCTDEPYVEPYWNHPNCPEVVCTATQWPIQVISSDGSPINSGGGVTISWFNPDTLETQNQDWIYTEAHETWIVTITYPAPDNCVYTAEYREDCCEGEVHIEALECPEVQEVRELQQYLEATRSTYTPQDYTTMEQTLREMSETARRGECDPCDEEWVLIQLVDELGDPLDTNCTVVWSDGGSGTMRGIPTDFFITVTVTKDMGDYDCVYTDEFIYECDPDCSEVTAPTNLQVVGTTLTWDPVPGAVEYIVSSPPGGQPILDCECRHGVSLAPVTVQVPSHDLPFSLHDDCFVWWVQAVCADGTISDHSEQACFAAVRASQSGIEKALVSPNPNNGVMQFVIETSYSTDMTIEVYDFYGRRIQTFTEQVTAHDEKSIAWDASARLSKGVYFIKFKTANETINKKVIVE